MSDAFLPEVPVMRVTLIYDGPLPSGDGKRALYAAKIRNHLHPQLKDLWENHVLMRQLAHEARVWKSPMASGHMPLLTAPKDYLETPKPVWKEQQIDLTAPIQ